MDYRCHHRCLRTAGRTLAWVLMFMVCPRFAYPQEPTNPVASEDNSAAVFPPCDAAEQPNPADKNAADCQPDKKSNGCPEPAPYKLLRYDEDYRYLKDPCCETDWWDPIKYIPLSGCEDSYLSIGGEVRERYEFVHNPNAGSGVANAQGENQDFLERYLLHEDLHLGPNFRFFGQFVSGLENGRIGGPRPDIDENVFNVHQAFANVVLPVDDEKDTLTGRIGRQEFEYGSGRLIDVRDGVNLRLSFDAARLLLHSGDWEVDGWWSKPVLNNRGVFDDEPDPRRSFWGVYSVHPLPLLPQGNIDLYYLGFQNEDAVYVQGTGSELRNTLGGEYGGSPCRGNTTSNTTGNSARSAPEPSRRGALRTRSATTSAICR